MKELAIFDLDNTLLKEQSQAALLGYAFKKRFIGLFFYIKTMLWFIAYKLGLAKDPKKIMEYAFNFLKDKEEKEFKKIIKNFFDTRLHDYIFRKSFDLIKQHKEEGRKTLIVSNSIEYISEVIAEFLGIDYFIGTKLETKEGKFTGKIKGDIIYGKNKIPAINEFVKENNLSLVGSWGYSDHHSDLPFLGMVDNPVVVNPTKKLLEKAKGLNWPILTFEETIN